MMSVVLPFPQNSAAKREAVPFAGTADIVIFPGVRVERRSFDLAAALTSQRRRRASQAAIDEDSVN